MGNFTTEQEQFWAGAFGDEYIKRNQGETIVSQNNALFSKIIDRTRGVNSIIEFGANIGLNLRALKQLLPHAECSAIEINKTAIMELKRQSEIKVYEESILDFQPDYKRDFVFTKTVLIHINPDKLVEAYKTLYNSSRRYICVAEYYNSTPVEVMYRGHTGKLFKRDFAGELLELFPDLKLVDYGFVYNKDPNFPLDDITWFLLEKNPS